MKRILTALVLAAGLALGASAQQQPPPPQPPAPQTNITAEEASLHGFGDKDKTCQEWTDGCRFCQRDPNGGPVCSNIGPACQPKAITCSRRSEPAKQ